MFNPGKTIEKNNKIIAAWRILLRFLYWMFCVMGHFLYCFTSPLHPHPNLRSFVNELSRVAWTSLIFKFLFINACCISDFKNNNFLTGFIALSCCFVHVVSFSCLLHLDVVVLLCEFKLPKTIGSFAAIWDTTVPDGEINVELTGC